MTVEEMQKQLTTLSRAHRRRFPNFSVGKTVQVTLADGSSLFGEILSLDDIGLSIDSQSSAGGAGELAQFAWIEVIEGSLVN